MEVPIDPVTPDYFRTMGIPLLQGRTFSALDADTSARPVIINQTMARTFWPSGDALGRRIKYGDQDSSAPWLTIVGVVADMRRTGYDAPVRHETFLPYALNPSGSMQVVIRTRGDPLQAVQALRDAVRSVDPEQPVHAISSMEDRLGDMVSQRRFAMVLLVTFAGLALVLGLVGVYGVTSYLVTQRLSEMGVRIALGAPSAQVVGMVVRQGMIVAAAGLVVGLAASVGTTRLLGSLLYGLSPLDAVTFGGAAAALVVATLLANWIPARRAATADPLAVLRAD
jgi:predicted permease